MLSAHVIHSTSGDVDFSTSGNVKNRHGVHEFENVVPILFRELISLWSGRTRHDHGDSKPSLEFLDVAEFIHLGGSGRGIQWIIGFGSLSVTKGNPKS